jgi:GH24 family phage-related lysozyme (muramidase)
MNGSKQKKSYSFKDGLTMLAAKAVGIDPDLAVDAGDTARAAINLLRHASRTKQGKDRDNLIRQAQAEMKTLSAARHPQVYNAIQARLLALQGRGDEREIIHATAGEVVIPRRLLNPALLSAIGQAARAQGIYPSQLEVGHPLASINPATGTEEHGFFDAAATQIGPSISESGTNRTPTTQAADYDNLKYYLYETEKFNPKCKDDGFGNVTCGVGSNVGSINKLEGQKMIGQNWSQEQANRSLDASIADARRQVRSSVKVGLTPHQEDALTSMAFNIGPKFFSQAAKDDKGNPLLDDKGHSVKEPTTWLRKINQGDYEGAASEFANWNKVKGTPVKGLTRRREADRQYFMYGPAAAIRSWNSE